MELTPPHRTYALFLLQEELGRVAEAIGMKPGHAHKLQRCAKQLATAVFHSVSPPTPRARNFAREAAAFL